MKNNYASDNVKLWLLNDRFLYSVLIGFLSTYYTNKLEQAIEGIDGVFGVYKSFIDFLREEYLIIETEDQVAFNDNTIMHYKMDEWLSIFAKDHEETILKVKEEVHNYPKN
jgi:hypothetical protein